MASPQDIDFEELVEQAIRSIPTAFMERIGNLAILIEDSPNAEDLSMMERSPGSVIYGLYVGVPLDQRNSAYTMVAPDRIVIYRHALQHDFHAVDELRTQVRRTILHELGHALGLDHDKLADLGLA